MARDWNDEAAMRLAVAVCLLAACSTTRSMTVGNADALHRGRHAAPFDLGGMRVTPSSDLRFCRAIGDCSPWISAWRLRVDDVGAWWRDDAGYRWSEVTRIEVRDFDGLKTTGAILGGTALVATVIPILALAMVVRATPRGDGGSSQTFPEAKAAAVIAGAAVVAATEPAPAADPGAWPRSARPAEAGPKPLFSIPARIRSIASIGAVVDGGAIIERGLVTTGGVARLRLGDFLELGAGLRFATERRADGSWQRSRWYVAQGSFHAPITATVALPVGLDVAWGGDRELANEISAPWGFRYTRGRWSGTLHPVTPAWVKRDGDWTFGVVTGLSLGVTL